jgi:hypothetical protein
MASVAAAWSRVTGRGGSKSPLEGNLRKITHSEVLDIPKELFIPIVEASNNEEDRRELMTHIRECLAEPTGKHWRRINGGLMIVEALLKRGSPTLITETAEGRHFDLVQRLSFLEHFDYSDKRVINMIRSKAEALRKEVSPLIQNAGLKDSEDAAKDTASTCSPGSSTATRSTVSSCRGFGSDDIFGDSCLDLPEASKGTMILNNIVTVGHNDDTTDESEGDKARTQAPVRFREQKKLTTRERNERSRHSRGDSSDSDACSDEARPAARPPAQAPAPTVDLLDL